jgi:hypothetical protein
MIPIFLLTYNEQDFFVSTYTDEFVHEHFVPNNIHFYVLDNGNQPKIQQWCERHGYTYYASEYNIGSAGGFNWAFKTAHAMGITNALFMQSDLELSSAWPVLFTYALTETFSKTHFPVWPQILDDQENEIPYLTHLLPNLGNFFGFNAQILEQKDCYFDENFVVTHFDDMEYMHYIQVTKKMQALNVSKLLPGCKQFNQIEDLRGTGCKSKPFIVQFKDEFIKVHHAGPVLDRVNNYDKWYNFNRPYFDSTFNNGRRPPYDPNRWQQHGYPAYPILHELRRFFTTYPNLLVNHKFWDIANATV